MSSEMSSEVTDPGTETLTRTGRKADDEGGNATVGAYFIGTHPDASVKAGVDYSNEVQVCSFCVSLI